MSEIVLIDNHSSQLKRFTRNDDGSYTPHVMLEGSSGEAGTPSENVTTVQGISGGTPLPVVGPLTDSQLRATSVPVSGPLTDAQLRATTLPVTGPLTDGQLRATPVGVNGQISNMASSFTSPATTTSYTAGDVVSNDVTTTNPITFTNLFRVNGGSAYLVGARLSTNQKSITPRIRVHLFNLSNPTLSGDNLPYKEIFSDSSKRVGYFELPSMTTAADSTNSDMSRAIDMSLRVPIFADSASRNLYAVLETLDGCTKTSGQQWNLTLVTDQN